MLKNLKKGFLPFLIGFSAISVSGSAAFYSVFGLSKLFAGASMEVIIMAGSLEVAKLVTASLLYQYWDKINKILRTYLSIATIILVIITSMGIYGFLSAAYQDTFNQLTYVENEKKFIQQKVDFYQQDLTRYDKELQQILTILVLLVMPNHNPYKSRTPVWLEAFETPFPQLSYAWHKIELQLRKIIEKMFK